MDRVVEGNEPDIVSSEYSMDDLDMEMLKSRTA